MHVFKHFLHIKPCHASLGLPRRIFSCAVDSCNRKDQIMRNNTNNYHAKQAAVEQLHATESNAKGCTNSVETVVPCLRPGFEGQPKR